MKDPSPTHSAHAPTSGQTPPDPGPETAENLADHLAEFYATLNATEQRLLTGVVWRSLTPVQRIEYTPEAVAFNDAELRLLEELDR